MIKKSCVKDQFKKNYSINHQKIKCKNQFKNNYLINLQKIKCKNQFKKNYSIIKKTNSDFS